jgi:hypothetical protein
VPEDRGILLNETRRLHPTLCAFISEAIYDGRPEDEVTSAMIDAGVELFYDLPELLGPSNKELRDTVKRVFLLMLQMHREHRNVA